jgi:hypothetical protein
MSDLEILYRRSGDGDAYWQWLLSDHPDARRERARRQAENYQNARARLDAAGAVLAETWAGRRGPITRAAVEHAEAGAGQAAECAYRLNPAFGERDEALVTRLREELEARIRASGNPGYRYPARLTGPGAAGCPPPPPDATGPAEPVSLRDELKAMGWFGGK